MTPSAIFFHRDIFRLAAATCILFFLTTALAMLCYPGSTLVDSGAHGYSFFANFFSGLGATRTPSGATNTLSMILFTSALAIVGIGPSVFICGPHPVLP
jgi:hypothetical protein